MQINDILPLMHFIEETSAAARTRARLRNVKVVSYAQGAYPRSMKTRGSLPSEPHKAQ